jgi:hypothetical protein
MIRSNPSSDSGASTQYEVILATIGQPNEDLPKLRSRARAMEQELGQKANAADYLQGTARIRVESRLNDVRGRINLIDLCDRMQAESIINLGPGPLHIRRSAARTDD